MYQRFSRMSKMDKRTGSVTTNGSVIPGFSPEDYDIDILDNGTTIRDFINEKIKERIANDTEEPFLVGSLDRLYMTHLRWVANLPRVRPFFAVKCNNTPVVLKMLKSLGTGFDCASKNEIEQVMSLGATPDDIIYAHTTKPLSHIRYACTRGVERMTFDNEEELLKISHSHPNAKLVLRIAVDDSKSTVRLNGKFGAKLESVGKLLKRAKVLDLSVIGVSFHAGSGITDSVTFKQAITDARHTFDIATFLGFKMSLLDIGGGYTTRANFEVPFEELSEAINEALDEFFPPESGVMVIAEPGRFYGEPIFTLAVNVIGKKVVTDEMDKRGVEINSQKKTMMYFINDGLYGSFGLVAMHPNTTNIETYPYRAVKSSEQKHKTVLWGPTCDCRDKLLGTYCLPEMHVGEWLLMDNMGAYSVTMCTDFNGFERARLYTVVTADTWSKLNLSQIYNTY